MVGSTKDTQQTVFEVEYGATDRFTPELILITKNQNRDNFQLDRLLFRAQYRILGEPFQLAPFLDLLPSVHGDPLIAQYGFKALKNIENWSYLVTDKGVISKENEMLSYDYKFHALDAGIYYRFGLRGLTGIGWDYKTNGRQAIDYFIGGSISKNIFIGLNNSFGITKDEADYQSTINMTIYTGKSALGSYGLE